MHKTLTSLSHSHHQSGKIRYCCNASPPTQTNKQKNPQPMHKNDDNNDYIFLKKKTKMKTTAIIQGHVSHTSILSAPPMSHSKTSHLWNSKSPAMHWHQLTSIMALVVSPCFWSSLIGSIFCFSLLWGVMIIQIFPIILQLAPMRRSTSNDHLWLCYPNVIRFLACKKIYFVQTNNAIRKIKHHFRSFVQLFLNTRVSIELMAKVNTLSSLHPTLSSKPPGHCKFSPSHLA